MRLIPGNIRAIGIQQRGCRGDEDKYDGLFHIVGWSNLSFRSNRSNLSFWNYLNYQSILVLALDSLFLAPQETDRRWDVACADGTVGPNELLILQRIPRALGIRIDWYGYFASQRLGGQSSGRSASRDPLQEAYSVLGASADDSTDELKRKYRELAKKNHPDALRAQGLPEEMVGKATERMSRINEAWSRIREARGI